MLEIAGDQGDSWNSTKMLDITSPLLRGSTDASGYLPGIYGFSDYYATGYDATPCNAPRNKFLEISRGFSAKF
eukprot:1083081-Amorphochlora_amoeboformis.AAC.1